MAAPLLYGGVAALNLVGGYFASENIKESARLNQDISEMNAQFAELDAYDAEIEGFTQEARYQSVIDTTLSDQRLVAAATDVDVGFGSTADLARETAFIGELNKMEIEKQAHEQAAGFKTQAKQFRLQGFMQNLEAQTKASAALFGGVTSALGIGLDAVGKFGIPEFDFSSTASPEISKGITRNFRSSPTGYNSNRRTT